LQKIKDVLADTSTEADAITKVLEETMPKFMPLYDAIGKAEAAKNAAAAQAPEADPKDNVVDAEFTEVKDPEAKDSK
jgi:hypothetical protein